MNTIICSCCGEETEREFAYHFSDERIKICPGCNNCINNEINSVEDMLKNSSKRNVIRELAFRLVKRQLSPNAEEKG
ncbi:MAG: hypothetical protein ACW99G_01585 [Candidatus Thorarchaeota archaeon]